MKIIDGLKYREWQKRNSETFALLGKPQQIEARKLGYKNLGWDNVTKSWQILCKLKVQTETPPNVVGMFEHKLNQGDVVGAIALSLIEANRTQELARDTIDSLTKKQKQIDKLTKAALAKYPTL